jgi:HEAT repeat protein
MLSIVDWNRMTTKLIRCQPQRIMVLFCAIGIVTGCNRGKEAGVSTQNASRPKADPADPLYQGHPLSYHIKQLEKDENHQRVAVLMQHIGQPAVSALSDALRNENAKIREGAALSLLSIGPEAKEALPELIQTLRDPSEDVRMMAAMALGEIGPNALAAIPALQECLKDQSLSVRCYAAKAMIQISPAEKKRAGPVLITALNAGGLEGPLIASGCITELGGTFVPDLIKLLDNANDLVAASAANLLGAIGADAKEAIPVLKKATHHKSAKVRDRAKEALEKLQMGNAK